MKHKWWSRPTPVRQVGHSRWCWTTTASCRRITGMMKSHQMSRTEIVEMTQGHSREQQWDMLNDRELPIKQPETSGMKEIYPMNWWWYIWDKAQSPNSASVEHQDWQIATKVRSRGKSETMESYTYEWHWDTKIIQSHQWHNWDYVNPPQKVAVV